MWPPDWMIRFHASDAERDLSTEGDVLFVALDEARALAPTVEHQKIVVSGGAPQKKRTFAVPARGRGPG